MTEGSVIFSAEQCVVCLDAPTESTFAPCNHQCTCTTCSALIVEQKMNCPLCQSVIESTFGKDAPLLITEEELQDFFTHRREEYVKKLHAPCAKNAGFVGQSKLARSVASHMGDELEQRRAENAGTDRMCAKNIDMREEGDVLNIDYKVGRRKVHETAPFIANWSDVKEEFTNLLDGDIISDMDFAIYYPQVYWLWKYHKKPDLTGLVGSSKRRKR